MGDVPLATVHAGDTHVASNVMVDPVSKADQTQNVAAGSVIGPSHPNASK